MTTYFKFSVDELYTLEEVQRLGDRLRGRTYTLVDLPDERSRNPKSPR